MRDQYYEQLDQIVDELVIITDRVRTAVADATTALLETDLATAERVIGGESDIEESIDEVEERALVLLATQQPVATDLRQLVSTLRMVADLQRMSALAVHISKIARRRMPAAAVPAPVRPLIRDMARVAHSMIGSAARIVSERDLDAAAALEFEDDDMDRLRQELFRVLLEGEWEHGVDTAIDLALLGRYYERMGDHAVNMARRVVYLVTGELPVA
ncbi:phosphate signaling complex protein PhoU [Aeromicrobium duanguangcaii]|uniref:Phosphate-specific transport system accessory protein PhoU n=1 Tax=Aeromicrobium duanguangcaii TaxID=2968086 RepID=A0ABY5KGK3_9ACTN|nr:phosphate signaling complex protein PhoU [Aeromicrobium duanguangcaii]MCD9155183.1 phosphate signaling complex protein PhoU [Aeromicrobium duanguangcaii]MCL3838534.1 phosphate signaling complex protein PhoU [Aeromicrobium duanguangcaii]UUI68166.1 phosphate signaling complex protein PhoU [Aeromicrobium duanguangcaii]